MSQTLPGSRVPNQSLISAPLAAANTSAAHSFFPDILTGRRHAGHGVANWVTKAWMNVVAELFCTCFVVMVFILILARGITLGGTFDPLTNLTANLFLVAAGVGIPAAFAVLLYGFQPSGCLSVIVFEAATGQYCMDETTWSGRFFTTMMVNFFPKLAGQVAGWAIGGLSASKLMTHLGYAHTTIAITTVGVYGIASVGVGLGGLFCIMFLARYIFDRNTGKDSSRNASFERYGTAAEIAGWQHIASNGAILSALLTGFAVLMAGTHMTGMVNFWVGLTQFVWGSYAADKVVPFLLLGTKVISAVTAVGLAWLMELVLYTNVTRVHAE